MEMIFTAAVVRLFVVAALLGVLALVVHAATDDEDCGWLTLARGLGAVTTVMAGLALLADHPYALGLLV
jgi:hypothetical protein